MSNISSGIVIKNLIWRFAERCGAQSVTFVVSLILARLLAPSDYGVIALVTVFTTIMQTFVDSGFGSALIQKKDADDLDFSTVFFFNTTICVILYILMFFAAPFIAAFYENTELTAVIRVMSLTLVISGVKNVQQAYVSRNMIFKKFFFATLGGTVGAAFIGILMAYRGFGVWSLVAQQLFNAATDTVILWITVKWRPKRMFSISRFKGLFSYGWKLLASSLMETISQNLQQLVIGKFYSSADLAFYHKGRGYPYLILKNINDSLSSVLLPALATEQEKRDHLRMMIRRAIKTSTYVIWPLLFGLAVCCEPAVRLLLTDKWLPCVPFMRVFCISYLFCPQDSSNLSVLWAIGRSDLILKLDIIKKILLLSLLAIAMWYGPMAMAYSSLITTVLSSFINAWPGKKLIGYGFFDQLHDLFPPFLLSAAMAIPVYGISFLPLNDLTMLLVQILSGAAIYIGLSAIFHMESYTYIIATVKSMFSKPQKTE